MPHDLLALGPPIPPCQEQRNATVRFLSKMQPPSDAELDNILNLICKIMNSPAAFIALFDDQHIYCRNTVGFKKGDFPWRWSMCAWTMQKGHPQTLVIEDVDQDARTRDNEAAKALGVKFYVGAPLVASNGHRIGSICFVDSKPRKLDAYHCQILNNFSELVVRELEKDMALQLQQDEHSQLEQTYGQLQRAMDCFHSAVLFVNTAKDPWQIMHSNEAWIQLTGMAREDTAQWSLQELFTDKMGQGVAWHEYQSEVANAKEFTIKNVLCRTGHHEGMLDLLFRPAGNDTLSPGSIPIGVPSFLQPEPSSKQYYFVTITEQSASSTKSTSSGSLSRSARALEGLEVSTLLGCGAQGRVYFGRWFGIDVAVKVIDNVPVISSDPSKAPTCSDALEAVLSQDLSHPNVVRTLTYATTASQAPNSFEDSAMGCGDTLSSSCWDSADMNSFGCHTQSVASETWIVMEFCDRGTLLDACDKGWLRTTPSYATGLPHMPAVLATAHEIASAMTYLHGRGIIHGDLTAANVMLSSSGAAVDIGNRGFIAKVSDFGLSRDLDVKSKIKTNSYGTVTHMPPELLRSGVLGPATDVYAFGVLLWEMYTGSRPWPGMSHGQVIQAVSVEHRKLFVPSDTPADLAELLNDCMATEPKLRPSFHEICERLEAMDSYETSPSCLEDSAATEPAGFCMNSASGFEDL